MASAQTGTDVRIFRHGVGGRATRFVVPPRASTGVLLAIFEDELPASRNTEETRQRTRHSRLSRGRIEDGRPAAGESVVAENSGY